MKRVVWNCCSFVFLVMAVLVALLTVITAYLMSQGYLYHIQGWQRWFTLGLLAIWGWSYFETARFCRYKAGQH